MTSTPSASSAAGSPGVAVIGYAFMGKAHSNAWRNVAALRPGAPGVRQQVLVGRDADAVAAAAGQYGWTESATDWREVLDRDDIDIVDMCVPGHLHAEIAIAALEAGKHVIVEKPLANTMAEAEEMVATAKAARERGVHSMVGFNYRRVPALALAQRHIAEGRLGDVRQVRVVLPPGLARRRRRPDDLAAAPRARRLRRAGRPGLPRRRPGALPARPGGHRRQRGRRTPSSRSAPVPTDPRRSPSTTLRGAPCAPTAVPWSASRSPAWRPPARTPSASRSTAATAPCASTSSRSTTSTSASTAPTASAGARHRAGRPLHRRLVAARARPRLGRHLHQPGRRLPRRARRGHASRRRRSRTGSPSSACSPRSRPAPHAVASCVEVDGGPI